MGRCCAGLVIVALLQPLPAHATTANSLAGRVVIDGLLNDYSADEWVLDTGTNPRETSSDSRWGSDNDISRIALTWDRDFLYIGVEARSFDSFLELFISNRAGGLTTLEESGEFRRAIQLPNGVNLMALAQPGRIPDVARADESHPFSVVDRGAVPVAISGTRTGPVAFEMAVPWSMLSLAQSLKLAAAVTGEIGTGAGDAAPDASAALDRDRFARAVLDRWFQIDADGDDDGLADIGIAPRAVGRVETTTFPARSRTTAEAEVNSRPRAFAPDRNETTNLSFSMDNGNASSVYVEVTVYSMEGERIRRLAPYSFDASTGSVEFIWDGRDDSNRIVRGGTYVVVADWGNQAGAHDGRVKTAVVVAR